MKEYLTGNYLFKIAIVLIGVIYIAIYYNESLNNRYRSISDYSLIMDNRTGIIYNVISNKEKSCIHILDTVNGTFRAIPIKNITPSNSDLDRIPDSDIERFLPPKK